MCIRDRDNTTQLVDTIIDTNTRIDARENKVKPALHEQAVKIENKLEETLKTIKDDSSEIINIREGYEIKSKQSYLVYKNIQLTVYTQDIKTIEEFLILVTQSENITRGENTQHNYQPHVNYNENHNYNHNHNSDYYRPVSYTHLIYCVL